MVDSVAPKPRGGVLNPISLIFPYGTCGTWQKFLLNIWIAFIFDKYHLSYDAKSPVKYGRNIHNENQFSMILKN